MASAAQSALDLVSQFRQRPGSGLWPYVKPTVLADGMQSRIRNPNLVNQGMYGTCGPSALLRDYIGDDPVDYVKLNVDLYHAGRGQLHHGSYNGRFLAASVDLRRFRFDPSVNPADWMITASLRDSINSPHTFSATSVSGTTFAQQIALFREMGYTDIKSEGYLASDGKANQQRLQNARNANAYLSKNYRLMIGIDAGLLYDPPFNNVGGHWVDLLTSFVSQGDINNHDKATITFTVFSWGCTRRVPRSGCMTLKKFLDVYQGYIAVKY